MHYNPLFGDFMRVQIWDNDDFYEVQSQRHDGANSERHWTFNFGGGHHVEVWNNGKSGRVWLDSMCPISYISIRDTLIRTLSLQMLTPQLQTVGAPT